MAVSVVRSLRQYGGIDQTRLAEMFASEYVKDPRRGYGGTAHSILKQIGAGVPWKVASQQAFDGMGSMGNGGAMRAAPIGAYFADDISKTIEHARLSVEVTHTHSEGQAGAIAIAVAAAWAFTNRNKTNIGNSELIEYVAENMPDGETRRGLYKALRLPAECSVEMAAITLGNGSQVISSDTVPFTLWCAARHLHDYQEALWTTVAGYGDRDTTCAIVGGIVALNAGAASIPAEWREAREPLLSTS